MIIRLSGREAANVNNRRNALVGLIFVLAAVLIAQDWVEASHQSYRFYFSESALFQAGWLLCLPLGLLARWLHKLLEARTRLPHRLAILLVLFAIVVLHLLFYPLFINGLAYPFQNHGFGYGQSLGYAMSRFPILLFPVYWAWLWKVSPLQIPSDFHSQSTHQRLMLGTGKTKTWIHTNEILYIETARPYLQIVTTCSKMLHSQTLKELENTLDRQQFVRIHKSRIVNIHKVTSVKPNGSGDYELLLDSGHQLGVSRHYAKRVYQLLRNCD